MTSFITRSERSGNIFFRVTGLIRAGQLTWAQRPLWYDVYAAAPPLTPPDWNVKLAKNEDPVRKLFYEEDLLRARFYKAFRSTASINVESEKESVSQMFLKEYDVVKKESESSGSNLSEEELFSNTESRLAGAGISLK